MPFEGPCFEYLLCIMKPPVLNTVYVLSCNGFINLSPIVLLGIPESSDDSLSTVSRCGALQSKCQEEICQTCCARGAQQIPGLLDGSPAQPSIEKFNLEYNGSATHYFSPFGSWLLKPGIKQLSNSKYYLCWFCVERTDSNYNRFTAVQLHVHSLYLAVPWALSWSVLCYNTGSFAGK